MADDTDISGMPDPGTIGLAPAQDDPTAGMPDPHALFKAHKGYEAQTPEELQNFMRDPGATEDVRKSKSFGEGVSALSGLPRIAAIANPITPVVAGAAGALGYASDLPGMAAGAAMGRPDVIAAAADQAHERGNRWMSNIYKLADYLPAKISTKEGDELAEGVLNVPMAAGKSVNDSLVRPALGDNAADTIGEVGQDAAGLLPALGAKGPVRAGFNRTLNFADDVRAGKVKPASAPESTEYDHAGTAKTPSPAIKPDVGTPVSAESLRAAPNPIPAPEGTVAHARTPKAAPAAPPLMEDGANAFTLAREAEARRRMAEDGIEPEPYVEPFQGRQAEHEGAVALRNAQRGSVRLFNSPAEEGPKETPDPATVPVRQAHLDAIDKLSGGLLPTRRSSALTGDYNATGDDFQMKEVGHEGMRQQIASENAAMHAAAENVHASTGSDFENSVDSQTLGDRGRVTRGAIQGIEKHFDDATNEMYDAAREQNQGRPIESLKRVKAYLDDDSNFANDAEIGLQRAAKQRLERLWSTGDPDKGVPPGSVNAAEKFREFLNEKGKNPAAMGVANELKGHTDMDVAEHGGPGLFESARALRRHKYQMLEEPTGIKKLLAPADSQGINHAIPEHKVMDYIADLPREQHEHVMNVLRAGAHLDPEIAKSSAAAIREIQAHAISRMHAAATDADGSWNARKFYNAADRYARNAKETFKDRPDIINHLKTLNDAGNTLKMDKHYPGAIAQGERTGALGHAIEAGGAFASGLAHELPLGRILGKGIENATGKLTGKMSETARDKAVAKRIVDRNGKQRGSVQVMHDDSPAARMKDEFERTHPEDAPVGQLGKRVGRSTAELHTDPGDPNTVHLEKLAADQPGSGHGTAALQRITSLADKHGARVTLDAVPQGKSPVPADRLKSFYARHGFESDGNTEHSMTREPLSKQRGSVRVMDDKSADRERNPRSEYNANRQISGKAKLTPEQEEIIRKLGGSQRGSVKVMNEKDAEKLGVNPGTPISAAHRGAAGPQSIKSMADSFDKAITEHLSSDPATQKASVKNAKMEMEKYNVKELLSKNAKMMKSETGIEGGKPIELPDGRGVETTGLALAPAYEEKGFTTCPNSASCKESCLGKTSGGNFMFGGGSDLDALKGPRLAHFNNTMAMLGSPAEFAVKLNDEITKAEQKAKENGNKLGVRLNVLSDLHPRVHQAIIKAHPDVDFYDYTKNASNPVAPNHHYTYSSTGVSQPAGLNGLSTSVANPHQNWSRVRGRLDNGQNVAMSFSVKGKAGDTKLPKFVHDKETGKKYQVIDGDTHDYRPMDKQPDGQPGVVVGLRNKAGTTKYATATAQSKGFFVHHDPSKGDTVHIAPQPKSGPALNNDRTVEK